MRRSLAMCVSSLALACSGSDGADGGLSPVDAGPAADAGAVDAAPGRDAGARPDAGDGLVQVVFRVTVPEGTPEDAPVHVAGDFQGWDPSDPAYALAEVEPNVHEIALRFAPGTRLAFKFARGDWSRVEKGPNGEELADRTLTVGEGGTHRFTVATWADGSPLDSTIVGDVTRHQVPGFLDGRGVWVYLPPGYGDDPTARYPVLYMLDGQNLFDQRTSFAGEWAVDEALEAGVPAGEIAPLIVVGIDNAGPDRIDEYTPWEGTHQGRAIGGGGPAFLQRVIDVLKPWVDANYRTRAGPADTGFGGSSLGGLMAVYAAYAHPETFGRIAALSPSIWWDERHLVDYVSGAPAPGGVRLWVDMGTEEGGIQALRTLAAALEADGFVRGADLQVREVGGAGHDEGAWRARLPEVLGFLFPGD